MKTTKTTNTSSIPNLEIRRARGFSHLPRHARTSTRPSCRKAQSIHAASIREMTSRVKCGEMSALDITDRYLRQLEEAEPSVNAFLWWEAEQARNAAKNVDIAKAAGDPLGLLAGVPIAIKDNIIQQGSPTTCGSRILEGYSPPYDATCVAKLREAGAVLIGKTNMDEFGMGSTTEGSAYQVTKNPRDITRVPGGSSGGSAAAVAASQCAASLGSDTGGSIRQPASFCGVVGLKPTYGRVSRYGLVAYSSSLDVIGPLAHSVEDCAFVLQAIAGADTKDATSSPEQVDDYVSGLVSVTDVDSKPLAGKKLGLVKQTMGDGVDVTVKEAIMSACKHFESLGAEIVELSLPTFELGLPAYYVIASSEASSNLSRYDGVRYGTRAEAPDLAKMYCDTRKDGFGSEVKRRILMGTYTLSAGYYDAYYKRAQQVRTLVRNEMNAALGTVDALVSPAAPTPAYPIGSKVNDPLSMYAGDLMTINVNLAGLPAIVVPCGTSKSADYKDLPIGVQLVGRSFKEMQLLQLAHVFEVTSVVVGAVST